jgi:DNA processing protein
MDQEQKKYWLALNAISGLGVNGLKALIDAFATPRRVFAASMEDLCSITGIGKTIAQRIRRYNDWDRQEKDLKYYEKENISILNWEDPLYPPLLSHIYDSPALLFAKGNLQENECCIAVVGSRVASTYGMFVTERLCRELALQGITVVSGMARGIDSAAHKGAIAGKGRTIAVLGNGLDTIYPPENLSLCKSIAEHGALITEYPVETSPRPSNFPARNRIISGISLGVVVVEAGEKSGSLITAKFALEQGREVFAIPGAIDSPGSKGTHKLLKEGAKLVESVEDILDEVCHHIDGVTRPSPVLTDSSESKKSDIPKTTQKMEDLTRDEIAVWRKFNHAPKDVDELISLTGLSCQSMQHILMMLEMKGYIQKMPGSKYIPKE